jgi:hypothetical protein
MVGTMVSLQSNAFDGFDNKKGNKKKKKNWLWLAI